MRSNERAVGVALILMSSTAFGLAPTFAKLAYESGASVVGTMLARFTVATLLMLAVRKISTREVSWPAPKLFGQLFLLGAIGYFIAALLYFTALDRIDSGLAVVIFYCNPLIVVLLSWKIHGHKPSRLVVVCLVSTLVGVAITAGQVGNADTFSVVLVLIVAVEYAIYMIASSRVLPKVDLLTGVTIVMFGAACSFFIYWLVSPASVAVQFPETTLGWTSIVLIAVVSTVFPTATFYAGLKRIGTGKTAVITTFEPVVQIFAGVVFLSEPLTMPRIIGAIFVIGSVAALATSESRNEAAILHQ